VPLCRPQILHGLTLARILATAVGSRRLTACLNGIDRFLQTPEIIKCIQSSKDVKSLELLYRQCWA
jgi:hypothetical protein